MLLHPSVLVGRKNLPKGKAILCMNHRSNWDYVMFGVNSRKKYRVLAKKELFKNKAFAALLKNWGGVPIDREKNDIEAIKACIRHLKDGRQLLIFPEGTRLRDESKVFGEVKSGLALIAIKTRTPVVPVWITKRHRPFRFVKYIIGKPFELSQFYGQKLDDETLARASDVIRENMLALVPKKNK